VSWQCSEVVTSDCPLSCVLFSGFPTLPRSRQQRLSLRTWKRAIGRKLFELSGDRNALNCPELSRIICATVQTVTVIKCIHLVKISVELIRKGRGAVHCAGIPSQRGILMHKSVSGPRNKLSQFTKIYKSPRLTVMFSGIKICVSSSMPIHPYP
jgi:hypothetical protein